MSGAQYTQDNDEVVIDHDGRTIAYITCFKYQKTGHFADFCPNDV